MRFHLRPENGGLRWLRSLAPLSPVTPDGGTCAQSAFCAPLLPLKPPPSRRVGAPNPHRRLSSAVQCKKIFGDDQEKIKLMDVDVAQVVSKISFLHGVEAEAILSRLYYRGIPECPPRSAQPCHCSCRAECGGSGSFLVRVERRWASLSRPSWITDTVPKQSD
jgi:hypothetical protein